MFNQPTGLKVLHWDKEDAPKVYTPIGDDTIKDEKEQRSLLLKVLENHYGK